MNSPNLNCRIAVLAIAVIILSAGNAIGQFSPGDLHSAHENLEGLKNCEQCHSAGKQIDPQNCLNCHGFIKSSLESKTGLHGINEYNDCVGCHIDHLGRDSELIFWLDGQSSFDHTQTGYNLESKHAALKCRDCHKAAHIAKPTDLAEAGKDIDRTFLGLDRNCLNCHLDEHRQQLGSDCLSCHGYDSWKPAVKFSHDNARFKLIGKHTTVLCEKCHVSTTDNMYQDNISYAKFKPLEFYTCNNCHEDIHKGKLGSNCASCHIPTDWKAVNQADFDHSRTNFPLLGKHSTVKCDNCHKPGQERTTLIFANCTDCHTDYHLGQFANHSSQGQCSGCHTVDGFSPALFTIAMHYSSSFPLKGSHQAIPCIACHKPMIFSDSIETIQFDFDTKTCQTCHQDPHNRQVDKYLAKSGCEYCHNENSWKAISFDHSQTKFALEGKHTSIECAKCHKTENITDKLNVVFTNLANDCESCHNDIHRSQFAVKSEDKSSTDCSRCHTPNDWYPRKFDHSQTSFALDGAHIKVKCEGCHQKINQDGNEFTWFKPAGKTCSDCHGDKYSEEDREG